MILKYLANRVPLLRPQRYHVEIFKEPVLSYFTARHTVPLGLMASYKSVRPFSKSSRTDIGATLSKTYYNISIRNYCIWNEGNSSLRDKCNNTIRRSNAFKKLYKNIERE